MTDNNQRRLIQNSFMQNARTMKTLIVEFNLNSNSGHGQWIYRLAKLFIDISEAMDDLYLVICDFDVEFVNSFKATLKKHKHKLPSPDLIEPTYTNMKKIVEKAINFQFPLNRIFCRLDYPWYIIIAFDLAKYPEDSHSVITAELNTIQTFLKLTTDGFKAHALKYQKIVSNFFSGSVKLKQSADTIMTIIENDDLKQRNEILKREFDSLDKLFKGDSFRDFNDLDNLQKMFTILFDKLHRMFEYLPQKIQDYANKKTLMLWENSFNVFNPHEYENFIHYSTTESKSISEFKHTINGDEDKRLCIDSIDSFKSLILNNFVRMNIKIGAFDTKAIKFIKTELEPLETNPIVKSFIEKLNKFDAKCSSHNVRIPESIQIKYAADLSASQFPLLNSGAILSLKTDIDNAKVFILSKHLKLISLQRDLTNGCNFFIEMTKPISILLGNIIYIMKASIRESQKIDEITELITQIIDPLLTTAAGILDSKQWRNMVMPKLDDVSKLVKEINGAQRDLADKIREKIKPIIGASSFCT